MSGARLGVLDLAAYPTTVGVKYDIDQWSEELQLQGLALQHNLKYIVGFYAAAEIDVTDIPTVVGFNLPQPLQYFIITGPIAITRRQRTRRAPMICRSSPRG